jgi:importin-5
MRECAFRIFATTPGIIEKQHEGVVQEVFSKGFKDDSVDVRYHNSRAQDLSDGMNRSNSRQSKPSQHSSTRSQRRLKQSTTA